MQPTIDQLMRALVPDTIFFQLEQFISNRTYADVTLRLTHRNIQFSCPAFELAVNYEGIYATHIDSQDEASLIVKGVSRDQRS